jgi:hypothetical protein
MNITGEDAAAMYARACRAWYGPKAARVVRDKIQELRWADDYSGVVAWSQVAEKLAQPMDALKPDFEKRPAAASLRHRGGLDRRKKNFG